MKKLLWLGCFSYLLIGVAHIIGGSILEQLIEYYGLSYQDGGQWIMNQFLGFLVGVLFTPAISAKFGKRTTVLFAIGMLTISEAAYSLLLPWGWMLSFAPLAGLGFGMTEAIVGAMIIELHKEGTAAAMSKLETFFGVGALVIPLTAAYLIQQNIWQLSFPILAAMSGIIFVLWLTMSFGKLDDELAARRSAEMEQKSKSNASRGFSSGVTWGYSKRMLPVLLLAALFFMFYVGMEMSFSNYLPAILIEHANVSEVAAASTLSIFWGMITIGRIFAGVLADRVGYTKYLLTATAASAVVFGLMTLFKTYVWMAVFIGLSGLFFAGLFGIGLVYVNSLLPGTTERTTSIMVAFGGIGGALFPRITGWFMDRYTISAAMSYLVVLVVVLLLLLILWVAIGTRLKRDMSSAHA